MPNKTIKVQDLKKHFGKTKAVDGISFEVEKGEIFGFLGPNGAGKTTTIRCMMDFLRPQAGSIQILGLDAQKNSQELKNKIGFLSGEVRLYNGWTGQEHVQLVKKMRGSKDQVEELINKFDFDPSKKVRNLSSGNKQKLALILALMHQPKILILDEPTMGLDPLLQHTTYEIFRSEVQKGVTIFMSSHDLDDVEKVCDRICIIKEGKIVAVEKVRTLKKKRLYTIEVYFAQEVKSEDLISDEVQIGRVLKDGYILDVKGDIQGILKRLSKYKIKDLEIKHASLEDMFMEFYQ